jgi:hypothetical protein
MNEASYDILQRALYPEPLEAGIMEWLENIPPLKSLPHQAMRINSVNVITGPENSGKKYITHKYMQDFREKFKGSVRRPYLILFFDASSENQLLASYQTVLKRIYINDASNAPLGLAEIEALNEVLPLTVLKEALAQYLAMRISSRPTLLIYDNIATDIGKLKDKILYPRFADTTNKFTTVLVSTKGKHLDSVLQDPQIIMGNETPTGKLLKQTSQELFFEMALGNDWKMFDLKTGLGCEKILNFVGGYPVSFELFIRGMKHYGLSSKKMMDMISKAQKHSQQKLPERLDYPDNPMLVRQRAIALTLIEQLKKNEKLLLLKASMLSSEDSINSLSKDDINITNTLQSLGLLNLSAQPVRDFVRRAIILHVLDENNAKTDPNLMKEALSCLHKIFQKKQHSKESIRALLPRLDDVLATCEYLGATKETENNVEIKTLRAQLLDAVAFAFSQSARGAAKETMQCSEKAKKLIEDIAGINDKDNEDARLKKLQENGVATIYAEVLYTYGRHYFYNYDPDFKDRSKAMLDEAVKIVTEENKKLRAENKMLLFAEILYQRNGTLYWELESKDEQQIQSAIDQYEKMLKDEKIYLDKEKEIKLKDDKQHQRMVRRQIVKAETKLIRSKPVPCSDENLKSIIAKCEWMLKVSSEGEEHKKGSYHVVAGEFKLALVENYKRAGALQWHTDALAEARTHFKEAYNVSKTLKVKDYEYTQACIGLAKIDKKMTEYDKTKIQEVPIKERFHYAHKALISAKNRTLGKDHPEMKDAQRLYDTLYAQYLQKIEHAGPREIENLHEHEIKHRVIPVDEKDRVDPSKHPVVYIKLRMASLDPSEYMRVKEAKIILQSFGARKADLMKAETLAYPSNIRTLWH